MILVDTNVWSELVRSRPEPAVVAWEQKNCERLWLSTVVIGEFLAGVATMPAGRKKDVLAQTYDAILTLYADRIATFDLSAARRYASVLSLQETAGRDPGTADTQIAATALTRRMSLATRNVKHFGGLGIELIDPWAV